MTIQFALAILAEAGLSYLGLGTQPPAPSWGKMLNEAQTLMYLAPQLAIFPGLAIMATVLGLNLLGDGLRDLLDPRLRRLRCRGADDSSQRAQPQRRPGAAGRSGGDPDGCQRSYSGGGKPQPSQRVKRRE